MSQQSKIILYIAASLDGFIAGPKGEIDWLFHDQDYGYTDFLDTVDTILMGRTTYEQVLTFGEFPYSGKQCYVFSTTQSQPTKHVQFYQGDLLTFVRQIKKQSAKHIWLVGGTKLISSFASLQLIDQYIISIHPVILGAGITLFPPNLPQVDLLLMNCQMFSSGLVQLNYSVLARPL